MSDENSVRLTIGEYSLSIRRNVDFLVYDGKPFVWIEHESGEGMSTSMASFESVIDSFYKDNF